MNMFESRVFQSNRSKLSQIKLIDVCCYPQFLVLCGAAYRPTEEIDLRSIGWGNIFQLPFKHLRDYRLRLLCPFFIYSGFEVLFVITGFSLVLCCQSRLLNSRVALACIA